MTDTKCADAETKIDGYIVTLEFTDEPANDGGQASHCYIEHGRYSATLECADATGELDGPRGTEAITGATLARIREWAELRGY